MRASHGGHVKVVDKLLCHGARVNLQQEVIYILESCHCNLCGKINLMYECTFLFHHWHRVDTTVML